MGEFIAAAIVIGAIIIVVGTYGMFNRGKASACKRADTTESITRLYVYIPGDQLSRIVAELTAMQVMRKPGTVEFYETPTKLVRFIVD